jgi:hypothetical protein
MVFSIANLVSLANGKSGKMPLPFYYWNKDDDDVTTEGYFASDIGIRLGDQITIINANRDNKVEGYFTFSNNKLSFNAYEQLTTEPSPQLTGLQTQITELQNQITELQTQLTELQNQN